MSKRKIKFKLGEITVKNFEFEVEDEREIATAMFSEIQNKIVGAVQPDFGKVLLNVGESAINSTAANDIGTNSDSKGKRRAENLTGL